MLRRCYKDTCKTVPGDGGPWKIAEQTSVAPQKNLMKICKETNRRYPGDKKKVATKKEYAQAIHIVQTGSDKLKPGIS